MKKKTLGHLVSIEGHILSSSDEGSSTNQQFDMNHLSHDALKRG